MAPDFRTRRILLALAIVSLFVVVYVSLVAAPTAANFSAPLTQRIFYYHVPSAWVAYLAFAVTAASSALYLWRRDLDHDRLAAASAEIGLVFGLLALGTGVVWSRVEFGGSYSVFSDAKVITLLVLLLAYLAYAALRASVDERERRARLSAVFGLLAVLGVPLSYFASRLSVHPDFTRPGERLAPDLGMMLGACVLAFTALFAYLVAQRWALEEMRDKIRDLEEAA